MVVRYFWHGVQIAAFAFLAFVSLSVLTEQLTPGGVLLALFLPAAAGVWFFWLLPRIEIFLRVQWARKNYWWIGFYAFVVIAVITALVGRSP